MRQPLRTIRIPLRAPNSDITSDLAALHTATWEWGRYARRRRYAKPPPAQFNEDDTARALDLARLQSGAP